MRRLNAHLLGVQPLTHTFSLKPVPASSSGAYVSCIKHAGTTRSVHRRRHAKLSDMYQKHPWVLPEPGNPPLQPPMPVQQCRIKHENSMPCWAVRDSVWDSNGLFRREACDRPPHDASTLPQRILIYQQPPCFVHSQALGRLPCMLECRRLPAEHSAKPVQSRKPATRPGTLLSATKYDMGSVAKEGGCPGRSWAEP